MNEYINEDQKDIPCEELPCTNPPCKESLYESHSGEEQPCANLPCEELPCDSHSDEDRPFDVMDSLSVAIAAHLSEPESIQLFAKNLVHTYTKQAETRQDDDAFFDAIKPTMAQLIRLKDDTAKELRHLEAFLTENACENEGTTYAKDILGFLIEGIDDILLDYDIQPFAAEKGEYFNPRRQQVVKKIITDDPELIRVVAETLSCGYERKGNIISKERVSAYASK